MASLMNFESTDVALNDTESSKSIDDNGDDITCPILKNRTDKSCYLGKYCPLFHGKTARYNPTLDIYYISAFDSAHAGILSPQGQSAHEDQLPTTTSVLQLSQQHDPQQILWINGESIIGQEAPMVNYFDESQYLKKSSIGRNTRQRMQQKKQATKKWIKHKAHLAKYLPRFQSNAAYKCSEECINCEFSTAEMFAKHYVQSHQYPLIYYEQPMRIKFVKTMQHYRLQDEKLLHRCVIRFSFETDEFFLLEYFETGAETSAVIYEFTEKQESKYGYELQALDSNLNQGKKECLPISAMHSKNKIPCSFISGTKSSEFFLRIYSRTKDIQYNHTQLLSRPGCELCASNHNATSDCAKKFVIHKNLPAFNDKQKAQQLQEFSQREKKLKTHRQNNLTWNNIMDESSLKFLPVAFLIPTKNLFNCDGVQEFVQNKNIEVETQEKKLIRMLEEEEEKNKLLDRENEEFRLKIDKLERKIEHQQQSTFNHPYKKIKTSHVNSQFKPVINKSQSFTATTTVPNDSDNGRWVDKLNTLCCRNNWQFKYFECAERTILENHWQGYYKVTKYGETITGNRGSGLKKVDARHCAAKLIIHMMGEENNV